MIVDSLDETETLRIGTHWFESFESSKSNVGSISVVHVFFIGILAMFALGSQLNCRSEVQ